MLRDIDVQGCSREEREQIEATVHAEGAVLDQDIRALRQEIRELKAMLAAPRS